MAKTPEACGLILCEKISIDVVRGRMSLEGVFLLREFATFPTESETFTCYAAFFDGRGEGVMSCECMHLESEKSVHYHKWWAAFPDAGRTTHQEIPIKNVVFPRPGRYSVTVKFDDNTVAIRYFDVLEKRQ